MTTRNFPSTVAIAALLALTIGTLPLRAADQSAPAQSAPTQDWEGVLKAAMKDTKIPAMGLLILRKGKVVAQAVHGKRAADASDPVQSTDVWHLGSNGKAMTATLIAKLVERGILSWDKPLSVLLPELAEDMQAGYREVTLRDLFAHQAGQLENISDERITAFYADKRPLRLQRMDYAKAALAQPPAYPRGTTEGYSNNGPLIAAVVAERATGKAYEELMQQEVFGPLGITGAGFGPTHRGQPLSHVLGVPKEGPEADVPAALAPAGGIHMSLQDWSRFALDQLNGERGRGKLLTQASYTLLHTAPRPGGKFSLGWRNQPTMAGVTGPFISHSGSNDMWFAIIVLRPGTEDGVLVTANAGPDIQANAAVVDVAKQVVKKFDAK